MDVELLQLKVLSTKSRRAINDNLHRRSQILEFRSLDRGDIQSRYLSCKRDIPVDIDGRLDLGCCAERVARLEVRPVERSEKSSISEFADLDGSSTCRPAVERCAMDTASRRLRRQEGESKSDEGCREHF